MCGILGIVAKSPVNQQLYDGLLGLQPRGQDAPGSVRAGAAKGHHLDPNGIFPAVSGVPRRCSGAYAIIAMIAGYGMLAIRDPFGIRPLVVGKKGSEMGTEFMVASESVALDALGFKYLRDVAPGEAILVDESGNFHSRQCAENPSLNPCLFEFVYLARPDSVI